MLIYSLLHTVYLVTIAVKKVVKDEDFKVPSDTARRAVETAEKLLEWVAVNDDNMKVFSNFSDKLVQVFEKCFVTRRSMKVEAECMWREFHVLRSSDNFKETWETFLHQSINHVASPAFFQFVSYEVFETMVKEKWEIPSSVQNQASPMTVEEENALRYVSGYICRKVQTKIKASTLSHKDAMVLFLSELIDNELDEEEQESENWIRAIDRGGLWHVSENTYLIFFLMEEEIRKQLIVDKARDLSSGTKKNLLYAILANEDLLFQWSLLTVNIDDDISSMILNKIAELFVTVRGFAFASSCLELYKQQFKKRTQKSKSLRKKLITE